MFVLLSLYMLLFQQLDTLSKLLWGLFNMFHTFVDVLDTFMHSLCWWHCWGWTRVWWPTCFILFVLSSLLFTTMSFEWVLQLTRNNILQHLFQFILSYPCYSHLQLLSICSFLQQLYHNLSSIFSNKITLHSLLNCPSFTTNQLDYPTSTYLTPCELPLCCNCLNNN